MRKKDFIKNLLRVSVSVFIFFFILKSINLLDFLAVIRSSRFEMFLGGVLIYFLAIAIVGYRLKILMGLTETINFRGVFVSNLFGMLCAEVTPGRIGYFLSVQNLSNKYRIKRSDILSLLFLTQMIDFTFRVIISVFALVYLSIYLTLPSNRMFITLFFFALIFVIMMFVLLSERFFLLVESIKFIPKREKILHAISKIKTHTKSVKRLYKEMVFLTILSWIFTSLRWFFIGEALGLNLPVFVYIFGQPLLFAVSFIPITFGGFGVLEGSIALFFVALGVPYPTAFAFSLFDRGTMIMAESLGIFDIKYFFKYSA